MSLHSNSCKATTPIKLDVLENLSMTNISLPPTFHQPHACHVSSMTLISSYLICVYTSMHITAIMKPSHCRLSTDCLCNWVCHVQLWCQGWGCSYLLRVDSKDIKTKASSSSTETVVTRTQRTLTRAVMKSQWHNCSLCLIEVFEANATSQTRKRAHQKWW